MSAISDFSDKMKAHQDEADGHITGAVADVVALNAQIAALQASAGVLTPEDQGLVDAIEARAKTLGDKLAALDAMAPPPVPVVPDGQQQRRS